jgi:hypothetical protein
LEYPTELEKLLGEYRKTFILLRKMENSLQLPKLEPHFDLQYFKVRLILLEKLKDLEYKIRTTEGYNS